MDGKFAPPVPDAPLKGFNPGFSALVRQTGMAKKTRRVDELVERAYRVWVAAWRGEPGSHERLAQWLARSPDHLKAFLFIATLAREAVNELPATRTGTAASRTGVSP